MKTWLWTIGVIVGFVLFGYLMYKADIPYVKKRAAKLIHIVYQAEEKNLSHCGAKYFVTRAVSDSEKASIEDSQKYPKRIYLISSNKCIASVVSVDKGHFKYEFLLKQGTNTVLVIKDSVFKMKLPGKMDIGQANKMFVNRIHVGIEEFMKSIFVTTESMKGKEYKTRILLKRGNMGDFEGSIGYAKKIEVTSSGKTVVYSMSKPTSLIQKYFKPHYLCPYVVEPGFELSEEEIIDSFFVFGLHAMTFLQIQTI